MSLVFQDPVASLNPLMRIRDQLTEAMRAHGKSRAEANSRAVELMEMVGIPDPEARLADYPLAFSGGMSQRVMIAIALANNPDVIIADEPTHRPGCDDPVADPGTSGKAESRERYGGHLISTTWASWPGCASGWL